jgi:tetratricopeptide (TPR) repeat protein
VLSAVLSLALVATAVWSAINYRAFITALGEGVTSGDYRAAATKIQTLAAADPNLAIYPQQAGMLLGLAAGAGDKAATTDAIAQFRRFTALEPYYASGWANLAALYFANGDLTPAADAMRKAVELAPLSWSLMYRYGIYAEAAGDVEAARQAYARTQALNSGAFLLPDWNQSPLRREIEIDDGEIFPSVRVLRLLEQGDAASARQVWDQAVADGIIVNSSTNHVTDMLLLMAEGDTAAAESALQAARAAADDRTSRAWVYVGAALFEPAHFDEQIANARIALQPALPTASDWAFGENISYIQYLSLAIPRQFLPQVGYSEIEIPLIYLLNTPDALTRLSQVVSQT